MVPPQVLKLGRVVESLYSFMKRIPDPRSGKRIKHRCEDVLTCLVLGFCAGRTTIERALGWCTSHAPLLKRHMRLEHGIASDSTACRLLKGIDPQDFCDVFLQWASSLIPIKGACLIVDGKGTRAGAKKISGERTPYILNVVEATTGICVGITAVGPKENEKPAFHRLLDVLDIEGSLLLADAMATDAIIMEHINGKGGSFFFQVKKNNPETYAQLMTQMGILEQENKAMKEKGKCDPAYREPMETFSLAKTVERNRERHEYRFCCTTNDVSLLDRSQTDLPFLKTIGKTTQVRIPIERDNDGNNVTPSLKDFMNGGSKKKPAPTEGDGMEDDISRVGIVSNAVFDSETSMAAKRLYWTIENSTHYVLDNILREDRCTAKKSRENFALIRRIAYNVLRIIQIREGHRKDEIGKTSDSFCDYFSYAEKYIFGGIASFI